MSNKAPITQKIAEAKAILAKKEAQKKAGEIVVKDEAVIDVAEQPKPKKSDK